MRNDRVVCISNKTSIRGIYNDLTIGKVYNIDRQYISMLLPEEIQHFCILIDDNGLIVSCSNSCFVSMDVWRDKLINEIVNE